MVTELDISCIPLFAREAHVRRISTLNLFMSTGTFPSFLKIKNGDPQLF